MVEGMVSCIIPTYKRSDTLIAAIQSVLTQTYKNIEVIIVDDNEPNDCYSLIVQEKLANISDNRVRYIQQQRHINGAAARNMGMGFANGEYVAFLDDDDEWLPEKIERQVVSLESESKFGGVSCLYAYYKDGVPKRKCPPYDSNDLHKKVLERSVAIYTSTVLFKKKCLNKTVSFDERLKRHQDLQFLLDFLVKYDMMVLNEYYVKINVDSDVNRASADNVENIKRDFFQSVKKHFEIYDIKTRRTIYAAHYFEVIFVAMKKKRILIVLSCLLKIGINVKAYINVLKRLYLRRKNIIQ